LLKKIFKTLTIVLILLSIINCSTTKFQKYQEPDKSWFYNIDSIHFEKKIDTLKNKNADIDKLKNQFYRVWISEKYPKKENSNWGIRQFKRKKIFGENKKEHYKKFISNIEKNIDLSDYPNINRDAITTDYCNIKIIPTIKPIFYSFGLAGEGYPFDNNQNSSLWANTPVRVLQQSKDGRWVFIDSPVTLGWVETSKIAFVDKKFEEEFMKKKLVAINRDNVSLFSKSGKYIQNAMMGSIYPISDSGFVYAATKEKLDSAVLIKAVVDSANFSLIPIELNDSSMIKFIKKLINTKYGWGGSFENRDCSSMLRDLFIPYGLMLPRSSSYQKRVGDFISFDSLSVKQRLDLIRKKAIPYRTLFYKKGHIMLYIGSDVNRSYMFHNLWGLKTEDDKGNYGRIEVSKAVITDVEIGKNVNFVKKSILEKLTGMNILFSE